MLGQEFICIFALFPSPYLSPLWRQIAASIIEAHHPGVSGVEIRNFEIGITALQTHAQPGSEMVNRRWSEGLCQWRGRGDSLSIFTLAGSTKRRRQQRRQNIIESPELSPLTTGHSCTTSVTIKLTAMLLTKVNQTELIIIVLSHTNRAKFCLNLIGHQALK